MKQEEINERLEAVIKKTEERKVIEQQKIFELQEIPRLAKAAADNDMPIIVSKIEDEAARTDLGIISTKVVIHVNMPANLSKEVWFMYFGVFIERVEELLPAKFRTEGETCSYPKTATFAIKWD